MNDVGVGMRLLHSPVMRGRRRWVGSTSSKPGRRGWPWKQGLSAKVLLAVDSGAYMHRAFVGGIDRAALGIL
jgi:hypothetical protein